MNHVPRGCFGPSETELYIRFADVDMMEVVHHSAYLHWFEQIRFKFLREVLGLQFSHLLREQVALPLIACEIQYRHAFRFGESPVGYVRLQMFKEAKVALHYAVYKRETGELAATGVSTHCFMGPQLKLLLRTPAFFQRALAATLERHPDCVVEAGPR